MIIGSISRSASGQVIVGDSIPLTVTLLSFTGDPAGSVWTAAYQVQNPDRTWGPWQVFASGPVPALTAGTPVKQATAALATASGFVQFGVSIDGGTYRVSNSLFVALVKTPQLVTAPGDSAIIADNDVDSVIMNIGGATSAATTATCKIMTGGVRNAMTGQIEFADPTWYNLASVNVATISSGGKRNITFPITGVAKRPGYTQIEVEVAGGTGYFTNGSQIA